MKQNVIPILLALWLSLWETGCIREEPPCPYADVEAFSLPEKIMLVPASINREQITIYVRADADLSSLTPTVTLSEGAVMTPPASEPQDFSRPVTYTVTAADGRHRRTYTVQPVSTPMYAYGFEHWEAASPSDRYETPVEYDPLQRRSAPWDSGNKGIAIYRQYPDASQYPVRRTTESAEGLYAAEMITQKGPGSILGFIHIPIVAGSLFTGVLNPLNALKNPLLATSFGQPFDEKPLRLTGHYLYHAGEGVYIDSQGNPRRELRDSCAVYAVFFRSDATLERLDGTNILTHPNIVAVAMMPPEDRAGTPGKGFKAFDVPFEYRGNHLVDFKTNTYKLALVFSSSFLGDSYEGTPGSRLVVDDVRIETANESINR
jgi:hypothetical protein